MNTLAPILEIFIEMYCIEFKLKSLTVLWDINLCSGYFLLTLRGNIPSQGWLSWGSWLSCNMVFSTIHFIIHIQWERDAIIGHPYPSKITNALGEGFHSLNKGLNWVVWIRLHPEMRVRLVRWFHAWSR